MAQSTILAAGQTAATSTDIVVADGESVKVGLFVAAGRVPTGVQCTIVEDTPGADNPVGLLGAALSVVIAGPGTYRVLRPAIGHIGVNVGVFTE